MNFSAISTKTLLGRLIRLPLKLIPSRARIPILQGPGRGMLWIVGSGNHGCWAGSFEAEKQWKFAAELSRGKVVYDLGAHAGFYTLIGARMVGLGGRVVAFEPLPENVDYLRAHVRLNGLDNVTVHEAAVADRQGTGEFVVTQDRSTGRLADGGSEERKTIQVPVTTIDELVERNGLSPPDVVKIDVEGAEAAVLKGARKVLARRRPVVFLATHGPRVHARSVQLLAQLGYELRCIGGSERELLARPI